MSYMSDIENDTGKVLKSHWMQLHAVYDSTLITTDILIDLSCVLILALILDASCDQYQGYLGTKCSDTISCHHNTLHSDNNKVHMIKSVHLYKHQLLLVIVSFIGHCRNHNTNYYTSA